MSTSSLYGQVAVDRVPVRSDAQASIKVSKVSPSGHSWCEQMLRVSSVCAVSWNEQSLNESDVCSWVARNVTHHFQLNTDHVASGASTSVHTQGERVLSESGTGISESSAPSSSACRAMSLRVSKVSASGALAVRANALGITFTSPSQFDFFNYLIYDTTTSQHNALIVPSNGKE